MSIEPNTLPAGTPPADNNEDKGGQKGTETPKTFSAEEHQAELDRIASKTREEERKKAEKAIADAVAKATEEAERRAKLSEEERAKELQAKQQKEFEERERSVTLRENRAAAIEKFAELKLPTKLVDFVIDTDTAAQEGKITSLNEAFNQAVKDGVAEALKGKAPTDVNAGKSSVDTNIPEPKNFL